MSCLVNIVSSLHNNWTVIKMKMKVNIREQNFSDRPGYAAGWSNKGDFWNFGLQKSLNRVGAWNSGEDELDYAGQSQDVSEGKHINKWPASNLWYFDKEGDCVLHLS